MSNLQFYTTFQIGWLNAWIPMFALMLVQVVFMLPFKEGRERAVDTSWYTPKDKRYATASTILQWVILLMSLFIPLKIGTPWFTVGTALFVVAIAGMIAALYAYVKTPRNEAVRHGIYRYSRNPMYLFFTLGAVAACIASASLWMLIVIIPFVCVMHGIILGEERYCEETYGQDYLDYKKQTARYFGVRRGGVGSLKSGDGSPKTEVESRKMEVGRREM